MSAQSIRPYGHAARAAAFAFVLSFIVSPSHAQGAAQAATSPFESLSGNWSGNGTIKLSSGANERIRCRATYTVQQGGSLLLQNLRCASESYKFEVKTNVRYEAGAIHGVWSEMTNQVTGTVSGQASSDEIQASVAGVGFSASMVLTTRGERPSVTIRPQGIEVTEVSIKLER
jgi:hypothetical protein